MPTEQKKTLSTTCVHAIDVEGENIRKTVWQICIESVANSGEISFMSSLLIQNIIRITCAHIERRGVHSTKSTGPSYLNESLECFLQVTFFFLFFFIPTCLIGFQVS